MDSVGIWRLIKTIKPGLTVFHVMVEIEFKNIFFLFRVRKKQKKNTTKCCVILIN